MRCSIERARTRRQRDELPRAIDQLTIQLAVGVPRDAATGGLRRVLRDVPLRQRGRVQDVFVPAADEDDRDVARDFVEIAAQRQALLLELRLVPVAVRHDDVSGRALLGARGRWPRAPRRSVRARDRSTPGPPPAVCRWLSVRPGVTVRPFRSIWRVAGPASLRTSSFVPTAVNLSPVMATACAYENRSSTVTILPL